MPPFVINVTFKKSLIDATIFWPLIHILLLILHQRQILVIVFIKKY